MYDHHSPQMSTYIIIINWRHIIIGSSGMTKNYVDDAAAAATANSVQDATGLGPVSPKWRWLNILRDDERFRKTSTPICIMIIPRIIYRGTRQMAQKLERRHLFFSSSSVKKTQIKRLRLYTFEMQATCARHDTLDSQRRRCRRQSTGIV